MKFYVAAKLEEFQRVLDKEAMLKEVGHEIAFSWAQVVKDSGNASENNPQLISYHALVKVTSAEDCTVTPGK